MPPSLPAAPPDPVLQFLEDRVRQDAEDFPAWNKLADHFLQLLRSTGDLRYLQRAAHASEASLKAMKADLNPAGLGVRGRVELAQHRFAAALGTGKELQKLQPAKVGGLVLISDASFELGDYRTAEEALAAAVRQEETLSVGSESRAAKLAMVRGDLKKAAELFERALAITRLEQVAPETIAWSQVQLGELAFKRGEWEQAEKLYAAAAKSQSGWYVVEDHLAELRGAQGRYEEAVAAYERLAERVPRPELYQALGDLHVFSGKPELAKPWFDKAQALYTQSLERGEVLYLHHASGFYADSTGEPEKALEAAAKDLELRQSIYAWDALAWAQYKAGHMKEALGSIEKALATGVKDPHILYHASMIRMSAGDTKGGKAALKQAVAVNPRYNSFHAHR